MLTVSCPQCSQKLKAPDEVRGKLVKCATCGHHFAVEKPARGQAAFNSTWTAPSQVADSPLPRRSKKFVYLVAGLASAAAALLLVLVVVVAVFATSSFGRSPQLATATTAPNAPAGQSTDELQAENHRLKTELAQLETSAHQADDLKAENARLKSQIALLEAAAQKAQTERAAAATTVGDTTGADHPSDNPIVQQWHLENAAVEVQVLKIVSNSIGARVTFHVTNRSKAFVSFWEVAASAYDRAGKFLGTDTVQGTNLRPNDSTDEETTFRDLDPSAVSRWVFRLKDTSIQNDGGEKLFDADKYFTIKEVKEP